MQGDRNEEEWMGLKHGDSVLVMGIKGQFLFQNVRMDGAVPIWVTVARGPSQKRSGTRMVTPDRICIAHGRSVTRVLKEDA